MPRAENKKAVAPKALATKDEYFKYAHYSVCYSATVSNTITKEQREMSSPSSACFSSLLSLLRTINSKSHEYDKFAINVRLIVNKNSHSENPDAYKSNSTIFEKDKIIEYLNEVKRVFECEELSLEERPDDKYAITVKYTATVGKVIVLLSQIRFLYECPMMQALYLAYQYIEAHPDLRDYFFYVVNSIIVLLGKNIGFGHCYFSPSIFKKITNDDFKKLLNEYQFKDGSGYSFSKDMLIKKQVDYRYHDSFDLYNEKNLIEIKHSYNALIDGTLIKYLEKDFNRIFYEENS